MFRKLDLMILRGFVGPFVASFFIALFVLVMQTLWLYIDDIIGKGAGILVIMEFLFYLSLSLVPLALPIGVLLSGVFLFGNLGERYELSSIKSAGISLLRIMRPIVLLSMMIVMTSWFFSDIIIPRANLKFLSRLHDLKRQKPTLSLEEGIFNDDFYGYVIRIEDKANDGKSIQNVLIDDHNNLNSKSTISSEDGKMYVTQGGKFLVMELRQGELYQVPDKSSANQSIYPFVRTRFKNLTKVFALDEFNLERSDEDLFKNNQRMKNSTQLRIELDSIQKELDNNLPEALSKYVRDFKSQKNSLANSKILSAANSGSDAEILKTDWKQRSYLGFTTNDFDPDSILQIYHSDDTAVVRVVARAAMHIAERDFESYSGFLESEKSLNKKAAKFAYELYIKYSYALVCLLFVFIGAPLGAIVRKGGYGYPLILCIFVFVVYILLNTLFKRLSESLAVSPEIGAFLPCAIILLPGILLSWTAQLDLNPISWIKVNWMRRN
ncbi:MAG: LptF/LptG family permease [Saprospiraceae bacterium]|nr:LptF/LptG family permease [Saprospiraceae bacterium]